jgi:EamA domain-containing membrane protein RarD
MLVLLEFEGMRMVRQHGIVSFFIACFSIACLQFFLTFPANLLTRTLCFLRCVYSFCFQLCLRHVHRSCDGFLQRVDLVRRPLRVVASPSDGATVGGSMPHQAGLCSLCGT